MSGQSCLRRVTRRMLGILDNMAAIPGEGDHTMPRQHSDIPISARPALLVSLLLAIILPASLLVCTYATADSATTESSAAHAVAPTTPGISGEEGGREAEQKSSNPPDITTQPTETANIPTVTAPTSPSPLATPSPLNPTQPTPSISPTPDKTSTPNEKDSAELQARASTTHTVTFSNPQGIDTTQTIADGERVKRPADPTRDGYLFDGWFIGSTPVAYDFNQPVINDMNLTAHWTKADAWSMSPVQGPVAQAGSAMGQRNR